MLIYIFTNIFSRIKVVRNSFDEFNFLFFLIQYSHFIFLLLLSTIIRIKIKHIILLYLFNYCIYRFHKLLYALINLTKIKTKTKTKAKKKTKTKTKQTM